MPSNASSSAQQASATGRDRLAAYPRQEPLSPLGEAYSARVLALGEGVEGIDAHYGSDPHQSLTVFQADRPNGNVFLVFHGGGWTNGYKEWMYLMAPAFNAVGVTLISATYRLAPRHVYPAGFNDCADAVAWTYHHFIEATAGADRGLFVGGHSAGGHYAALLAVTDDWRKARDLPPDVIAGCLPISGTYWFGEGSGLSMRPRFLGADPANDAAASPMLRLQADTAPPFLLTYGADDFPHLVRQADEMVTALRSANVPVDVEILQDCDHFEASIASGDASRPWVGRAARWMARQAPKAK